MICDLPEPVRLFLWSLRVIRRFPDSTHVVPGSNPRRRHRPQLLTFQVDPCLLMEESRLPPAYESANC